MSKAFWEGVITGFTIAAVAFVLGSALGNWSHPYEQCKRKYEDPNDIMECVWILENG
jgi:hypothetical protein